MRANTSHPSSMTLGALVLCVASACGQIEANPTADAAATFSTVDAGGPTSADADVLAIADAGAGDAVETNAVTALRFDGVDDFVRVPREIAEDFTIEAWIRTTTSRGGSNFWEGLGLIYADVADVHDDFGTAILNGHFAFGTGNPETTIESTTVVTTGEWVHVAAVRSMKDGVIRVFVNGVEEASAMTMNTLPLADPPSIDIGGNTVRARYFSGDIDEVRIWNVARTGVQIAATAQSSLVGSEPGLVGYWRMDEGTGTTLGDSSPSTSEGSLGAGSELASPVWITSNAPIF